jgi:hypothetical protein
MQRTQAFFPKSLIGQVILASAFFATFAVVLDPGDTDQLPLLAEFGLWFTHFLTFAMLYLAGVRGAQRLGMPQRWSLSLSAILLLPLAAVASLALDYGFGAPDEELSSPSPLWAAFLSELVAVTPLALIMALAIAAFLHRETTKPAEAAKPDHDPGLTDLLASAPAALGDDIIRLHARDHYVELITTKGSTLLTEQFGDCVDRLSGLNGVQCHRSHWISLNHVVALKPAGSTYKCTLTNGDDVPVSRRRYSELRDVVRAAAHPLNDRAQS